MYFKGIKKTLIVLFQFVYCIGLGATQPQTKEPLDLYLEYVARTYNGQDSTIIKGLCYMYQFNQPKGRKKFNSMLKKRSIVLSTEINDTVANIVQSLLLYYDSINNEEILLYINSPGGSVYAGLGIYDTMQFLSSDVRTHCGGMAASMSAVLLMAGKEGKRSVDPNSRIMIHQPKGKMTDSGVNVEIKEQEILKLKKEIYTIISNHCHQPFDKVWQDCDSDFWMNAEEAQKYGCIDEIRNISLLDK